MPTARRPVAAPHPAGPPPEAGYVCVPQRLITDLHDNALAIGLYSLVARLYLIAQTPITLSVPDVLRFDPALKRGAVVRAFDRLRAGGWLLDASQAGRKSRYTPTWGRVHGAALAWRLDQPCLGRPRHVASLRVDRRLLDVCMGKLTPHPTRAAVIARYLTMPVVSLADVGSYALTLAGIPRATPALRALGAVRGTEIQPLPSDARLLALISQRVLTLADEPRQPGDSAALTARGARRLGLAISAPTETAAAAQPLFFVPQEVIGKGIGNLIGNLIGHSGSLDSRATASQRAEGTIDTPSTGITWDSRDSRDEAIPPPTPQAPSGTDGGGGNDSPPLHAQEQGRRAPTIRSARHETRPTIPDTEATRLLQEINVRPEQLIELAGLPIDAVNAAIADGKAREGVRDLAGWAVSLLRSHRDYGWTIRPPAPRADSPEALRAAFARYAAEQESERAGAVASLPADLPPPAPALMENPSGGAGIWDEVLSTLKLQLTRQEFDTWFRHAALRFVENGVATIVVPNARVKERMETRFLGQLRDLLAMHAGVEVDVRVVLSGACQASEPSGVPEREMLPASQAAPHRQSRTLPPEPDPRPGWIAADRWVTLPALLRAALIGSTVVDGSVRAASPYLDRLLRTRYTGEVAALLAAAGGGAALVSIGDGACL